MALINSKDLLIHANQNKYAVGAFNVTNFDFIDSILNAAVSENFPIILQVAEVHSQYLDIEEAAPAIKGAARKVNIPVCINLDHGKSLKTVVRAIRAGFTSVMFDGSEYPFEENMERTGEIVKIAHSVGVSVEGEIGNVGGEVIGITAAAPSAPDERSFTDIAEAEMFVRETGLDALAVAIGNVHGMYKGEPMLDFDRLEKIRDAVGIPLVLHGGSGISDKDFQKAVSLGICKINFYTGLSKAAVEKVHEFIKEHPKSISYPDITKVAMKEAEKVVKKRLQVFGSASKCAAGKTLCKSCSGDSCKLEDPGMKPEAKTILYDDLIDKISREVIENLGKLKAFFGPGTRNLPLIDK